MSASHASSADYALALPPGTTIHQQYEIIGILGRPGGFGITYLARDVRLDCEVAIKEFIPRELAGRGIDRTTVVPHSAEEGELFRYGLQEFVKEAQRLARINHPNVVRVRNFFEAHGTAYLVMDYTPGRTLSSYLERVGGRMTPDVAVELMIHVLDGLAAVHAQEILHRDLKPENIYLTRDGRPLLLDFGAARQAVGQKSRNLTAVLTPGYAPWEQYSTEGGKQGFWTDIYGAAAVLYRMITGQSPPEASERLEHDPLVEPRLLAANLPPHVNAAIMAGLAVDRRRRPQTVSEFQDLLDGTQPAPQPVKPEIPPVQIRPAPPAKSTGMVWLAVTLSVIFLLGVVLALAAVSSPEGGATGDESFAATDTLATTTVVDTMMVDSATAATEGEQHNERGNRLFEEGRYAEAVEEYRQAIGLAPGDPVLHANLGLALYAMEQHAEAASAARDALLLDASNAFAYFVLGLALSRQGDHNEALDAFRTAVRLEPGTSRYRGNLANELYILERHQEAMAEAQEAIRLDPSNANAYNVAGNVYYAWAEYGAAVLQYEEAVRLEPGNATFRENLEGARAAGG